MDDILEAATSFRNALERCHKSLNVDGFKDFPNNSCGLTSSFLGTFFKDQGFGVFEYFIADVPGGTHAWLQKNDIVIDITADQFDHITDRVIVSNSSIWHQSLDAESQGEADFRDGGISLKEDELAYKTICFEIDKRT